MSTMAMCGSRPRRPAWAAAPGRSSTHPSNQNPAPGNPDTGPIVVRRAHDYAARRFSAEDLPFRSGTTSKETFCPSLRLLNPARSTALMCTKTSLPPSSGWMNPKPFWLLKNFTVPVVIYLFSQIVPHTRDVPQAGANVRAAPTCVKRTRPSVALTKSRRDVPRVQATKIQKCPRSAPRRFALPRRRSGL